MELYKPEREDLKFAESEISNLDHIKNKICKIFGHRWKYKDYSNFMKSNGEKYHFAASRNCTRCNQHSYFIGKWEDRVRSKFDFESDEQATRELVINSINYN